MVQPRQNRARQLFTRLHLWLGLGLGALMVLAGLTGSLLVFYVEIDGWLHPEQAAAGSAAPASYDRAIGTLRRTYPDKTGPWRIEVTHRPGAIPARYYNPPETAARDFAPMLVWLSPDGTRVLRRDFWGDTAMTWIYDLHYRLLMGRAGGVVFGYAGLALLVLLGSGLAAWWPRGSLAKALRYKPRSAPQRRWRDQHKLAGLAGLPVLAMLTATGVMLALPQESDAVLGMVLGAPQPLPQVRGQSGPDAQITPSAAMGAARAALPGARLAWIEIPGAGQAAYRLRLQAAGDPARRFPHSFVWIDQHRGTVLAMADARAAPLLNRFDNWLHPLHDGSAGGLALRLVVVLGGMAPLGLFVTGLRRWWAARRPRTQPTRAA